MATAVAIDANGLATFRAGHVGTFDVVAQATDGAGNSQTASDTLIVIDPNDVDAPVVSLISPANDSVITGNGSARHGDR